MSDDRYLLISTDTHAGLPPEEYRAYLDPEHREAFDYALANPAVVPTGLFTEEHQKFLDEWNKEIGDHGGMTGAWDMAVREKEMDADGVAAELIFPDADAVGVGGVSASPFGSGLSSTGDSDPVLVMAGAKAHNRWVAEFCASSSAPERHLAVAIVPVLHDIDAAVTEIEHALSAGIRGGVMIPTRWMSRPAYNDPIYDPIWALCQEAGVPIHTHSGVGPNDYGPSPGMLSIYAVESYWWAARPMWALILGGVFERFPQLKYVIAENGAWWAPDIFARMDSKWDGDHATRKFGPAAFKANLSMRPSEYFQRNCWFASSVMGQIEIDRRHEIGIDKLMWGHDFPHPEGTWPHTRAWLKERYAGVPVDETRRILGLNALDVYSFDADALAPIADQICPTVADVSGVQA
jgi:predicted TIM-barrel fold metal-dependent hydrolase